MEVAGSRVLLTGATGGIGRAIARTLHARGAAVVVSGRREEVLGEMRSELGDRVEVLLADLADAEGARSLAERAGAVDVLVACAGLPASGRLDGFEAEQIDRAIDVNLRAPVQLARALVPGMVERGRGHVVLVSSLAGKVAPARSALYAATKFGLRGFAAGLRQDLHGTGVGVTAVFPGFIRDAGMFAEAGVALPKGVGTSTPDEVAAAVARGIERGRGEIDVAPLALRLGALASAIAPDAFARVQRRLGSGGLGDSLAQGQRAKR